MLGLKCWYFFGYVFLRRGQTEVFCAERKSERGDQFIA